MSYPGQGRPADALGSSENKATPDDKKPGRSKPSTQENIHPKKKRTVGPTEEGSLALDRDWRKDPTDEPS
jgi:hypothetical protein